MKFFSKVILTILLSVSPLMVRNISACSYYYLPSIYQSYKNASVVFVGKVVATKGVRSERVFRFEINETYKGLEEAGKKEIEVANEENMCEGGFNVGESYLIYLYENNNKFYTYNFATRNAKLTDAQDQIYFLRELLKGKRESQVYGSVVRSDNDPTINQNRIVNLQNIKVKIEGNGKTFETVTDASGLYFFNKIPKGEYKIIPSLPDIYESYYSSEGAFLVLNSGRIVTGANIGRFLDTPEAEKQLEADLFSQGQISDGAYIKFSVYSNNKIKGRIFDSEGDEISANVQLVPISNPFQKIDNRFRDDIGKYFLAGYTPAKYYLVAEINAPIDGKDKIRYFYPNTETPARATTINIGETDNLELNWMLPITKRKLEGKIYWSDETPIVGDVRIVLSKSENFNDDELEKNYGVARLDGASRFSLDGYVGAEYWIQVFVFAETYIDGKLKITKVKATPLKIRVGKTNEPLKILIPKPDK